MWCHYVVEIVRRTTGLSIIITIYYRKDFPSLQRSSWFSNNDKMVFGISVVMILDRQYL